MKASNKIIKLFIGPSRLNATDGQPSTAKRFMVILLMLLVFEAVFRILNVENFRDEALIEDDYLGHVITPNLDIIIYNADKLPVQVTTIDYKGIGLRDDKIENPYIVVIGDSHAFGLAVNESDLWVNMLEKKIDKEVANMGIGSYGFVQEERMIEKYALELKPEIILWQFSANDYLESYRFTNRNLNLTYFNLKQFLINNIAIAKFVWAKLGSIKHDAAIVEYNDNNLSFVFEPYSFLNQADINEEIRIGEDFSKKALVRAKKLADDNSIKLIIVIIPSKEEIYFNLTNNYQMNSMRNFCIELGLNCIDMTEEFSTQAKMYKQLYFRKDAHLNPFGNEVLADYLYGQLVKSDR